MKGTQMLLKDKKSKACVLLMNLKQDNKNQVLIDKGNPLKEK